ncbi:unnamed protein product [Pieris macdunnoughi]|uniref:Uncharacterized protein n=1 Tax=Pieris macdunnoughi TaxID=345717 RepID=A0A821YF09_9NEOP|nr:unnamed protein product [Pieris macdunnoughi]
MLEGLRGSEEFSEVRYGGPMKATRGGVCKAGETPPLPPRLAPPAAPDNPKKRLPLAKGKTFVYNPCTCANTHT